MTDTNRSTHLVGESPDGRGLRYESLYILAHNCLHASSCANYRGSRDRLGRNHCEEAPAGNSHLRPCTAQNCPNFKQGKPNVEVFRRDKHTCEHKDTVLKESSYTAGDEILKIKVVKKEYIERCNDEVTLHHEDVRVILEHRFTTLDVCSFEELQSGEEVLVTLRNFYSHPGRERLADLLAKIGFEEVERSSSSRRVFILQKGVSK